MIAAESQDLTALPFQSTCITQEAEEFCLNNQATVPDQRCSDLKDAFPKCSSQACSVRELRGSQGEIDMTETPSSIMLKLSYGVRLTEQF